MHLLSDTVSGAKMKETEIKIELKKCFVLSSFQLQRKIFEVT